MKIFSDIILTMEQKCRRLWHDCYGDWRLCSIENNVLCKKKWNFRVRLWFELELLSNWDFCSVIKQIPIMQKFSRINHWWKQNETIVSYQNVFVFIQTYFPHDSTKRESIFGLIMCLLAKTITIFNDELQSMPQKNVQLHFKDSRMQKSPY